MLDELAPGDLINATLVVFTNGAYLTNVKKVGTAPLEKPPAEAPTPTASSGFELLKPGEAVPDATVRRSGRQEAHASRLQGLAGRDDVHLHEVPAADVLPADGSPLRDDPEDAEERSGAEGVHLVTRQLRSGDRHAAGAEEAREDARRRSRSGGRSSPAIATTIDQFAARFGVSVARAMNDPRDITHNLRTAIIDADGKLVEGLHRQRVDARAGARGSQDAGSRAIVIRDWRLGIRAGARCSRIASPDPDPESRPSPRERRLIARLRTPAAVQRYLNELPYNQEPRGRRDAAQLPRRGPHGCAHCLEAALFAAVVLEQHGYPPLVLSFESIDELDHVIFVYRRRGRWGSVARSRDPGLHGRKPVFATPRALALSYVDPYVDFTGRVTGYAVVDLRGDGRLRLAAGGRRTCGRSSGCCSTTRTGRFASSDRRVASAARRATARSGRHHRTQADLLRRTRAVDGAAAGIRSRYALADDAAAHSELPRLNPDRNRAWVW